jgi:NAD(P)-dependent dehydrogenase (short-subunit alcohol dehydrogenase family)
LRTLLPCSGTIVDVADDGGAGSAGRDVTGAPLAGRVAVVSGGGKGLGRSFCLALARQGARVVVSNRNRTVDDDGQGPADHVTAEIAAAGGEAVADYGDAADPAAGRAAVRTAVERWGRLDICVANAAIGTPGMFHRQPVPEFDEVLEINLAGSIRLARAAMAVMRPAGYGRIILVASGGGLHGDIGLSAYAASKGGLLAFGRSLAAEGAGKGILTNLLLPYALTQLTQTGMPADVRNQMDPDSVAPVLTALASEDCRLNGEYIITGGGRLRRASVVEWATVGLPPGPDLSPRQLADLLADSAHGAPREYRVAADAFADLVADTGGARGQDSAPAGW